MTIEIDRDAAFLAGLGEAIHVDVAGSESTSLRLWEDLQLDAVGMLRLVAYLDGHGVTLSDDAYSYLETVEDVLHYYRQGADVRAPIHDVDVLAIEPPTDAMSCQLASRRVRLRAVEPQDLDRLYRIASHPDVLAHWRYRGLTPSPEVFNQQLWAGVLAQFIIESRESQTVLGFISAYNASLSDGFAFLQILLDPGYSRAGWPHEGSILFVDHLFRCWPLRHLYLEALDANYKTLAGSSGIFEEEGRLRDHSFFDGRYHDLVTATLRRSWWDVHGKEFVHAIGAH
jgi:RimJ/RimL family protein N-acetyltransferase